MANTVQEIKVIGQMSSFKFLFFGWLFASQKTGFSGFRYRFIPSLRFGTGYASPYNPCHCLKLKNSKLNLIVIRGTRVLRNKRRVFFFEASLIFFLFSVLFFINDNLLNL